MVQRIFLLLRTDNRLRGTHGKATHGIQQKVLRLKGQLVKNAIIMSCRKKAMKEKATDSLRESFKQKMMKN